MRLQNESEMSKKRGLEWLGSALEMASATAMTVMLTVGIEKLKARAMGFMPGANDPSKSMGPEQYKAHLAAQWKDYNAERGIKTPIRNDPPLSSYGFDWGNNRNKDDYLSRF